MAGTKVEVDAYISTLFLESGGVVEEVCACAKVESRCERRGNVETGSCWADSRGESQTGKWAIGSGGTESTWRGSTEDARTGEVIGMEWSRGNVERCVFKSGGL